MIIKLEQFYCKKALGYLWSKRAELDPSQEAIIKSLWNNRQKRSAEGKQVITYKPSISKAGKLGWGRLYGSIGSLETLQRECRGTLCREFYTDIDIKNCHPVIVVQFAKRYYDYELPETQKYCNDRDTYLKQISDDRDVAKLEIIKVFYGGRPKFEFLLPLYDEIQKFSKYLWNLPKYAELADAVRHEKNMYGSFMSYIAQTEERKIMLVMKEALEQKGFKVDVLCYDGVMIRKDKEKVCDADLLRRVESYIEQHTDYAVELVDKQFVYYDMPENKDYEITAGVSLSQYMEMKTEFEKTHFYYYPSNKYAEIGRNGELVLYDKCHAKDYFKLRWHFTHSDRFADETSYFDLWLDDRNMRTIRMIDYKPTDDTEVFVKPLNFAYMKPATTVNNYTDAQILDGFRKMISIVTDNDGILADYLEKWFAHMIQCPFDLPGVAIVVTGGKGAGKDTLGDFIVNQLIGNFHAFNYTENEAFFGKHDIERIDRFFIKLEEADASICGKHQSSLKARITAFNNTVEPKGEKSITFPNYIRYFFTTNDAVPVNIGGNERRFVLLRTDNSYIGNSDFWTEMRKMMMNDKAGVIVANYLKTIDITDYNVRILPPNKYYDDMKQDDKSIEQLFLESDAWDGERIVPKDLFLKYRQYCIDNSYNGAGNCKSFGKRMAVLYRDGKIKRETISGQRVEYWR